MISIAYRILGGFLILVVCSASFITLFDYRNKIYKKINIYALKAPEQEVFDNALAKSIINDGGYILYFRHAERQKWIDVAMYDALEANHLPQAEHRYFRDAVCLSSRGKVQGKAMGEIVSFLKIPISQTIVSPSCRARQTAELAFSGYDSIDHTFMHRGPYLETTKDHLSMVKNVILGIEMKNGSNVVISAHNGVIFSDIFDELRVPFDNDLEEGGFYVIKKSNRKLTLAGYYKNFQYFHKQFETRGQKNF